MLNPSCVEEELLTVLLPISSLNWTENYMLVNILTFKKKSFIPSMTIPTV